MLDILVGCFLAGPSRANNSVRHLAAQVQTDETSRRAKRGSYHRRWLWDQEARRVAGLVARQYARTGSRPSQGWGTRYSRRQKVRMNFSIQGNRRREKGARTLFEPSAVRNLNPSPKYERGGCCRFSQSDLMNWPVSCWEAAVLGGSDAASPTTCSSCILVREEPRRRGKPRGLIP
jgi:hypothetical protein